MFYHTLTHYNRMTTMEKNAIIDTLESIENLPTLPVIIQQIQKLITNPRSNMNQIATVISKDQAIASRVIRLVNSAFYGLRRRISSIQQAIVILGLNTVKNLTIGVSVIKTFNDQTQRSFFDREQFWLHSFCCASCAKLIATRLNRPEPEDYFIVGLLHDIGILIEDQFFHQNFSQIMKESQDEQRGFIGAENRIMGITHCEIGEYMSRKWKLPDFIAYTMRFHHNPSLAPREAHECFDKILLTHIADIEIWRKGVGCFCKNFGQVFHPEADRFIKSKQVDITAILQQVEKEAKEMMHEWGL